jgi:hypothetical protein
VPGTMDSYRLRFRVLPAAAVVDIHLSCRSIYSISVLTITSSKCGWTHSHSGSAALLPSSTVDVTEGCEVEFGHGEEVVYEAGPVRLSGVFASAVIWPMLRLASLVSDRFRKVRDG